MRRLMIVDDEVHIGRSLVRLFRRTYIVCAVESARACLDAIDEFAPDIILTDFRMPGMNGIELLEEVARRHPKIIGVIMTGYGDLEGAEAFEVVEKPWNANELAAVISALLTKAAA